MPKKLNAVGSYIFAGGFTLGVSKHFNVLAHLEDGAYGVSSARKNFPKLPIHTDPSTWPLKKLAGTADLVYGNPLCAAWSDLNGKASSQ